MSERTGPPLLPSFLLGVGLGGFIDGIVLHQILQWHHILTAEGCCPATTVAGLEDNTLADGFFHLGGLLLGWGLFNLVEGLVDHQILGIHHVRDDLGAPLGWDLGFLAFGALLALAGWALIRSGRESRAAGTVRGSGEA